MTETSLLYLYKNMEYNFLFPAMSVDKIPKEGQQQGMMRTMYTNVVN